jgi:hypothetical protein
MAPVPRLPWRNVLLIALIALAVILLFTYAARYILDLNREEVPEAGPSTPEAEVESPFSYSFSSDGILHESSSASNSSSPYWWVDSGGKLIVENGVGKTLQGELPESDPWVRRYARSSEEDTDGGVHPQNIFRLVTRSKWDNVRTDASFRILADNFSESENRNESNGLLLMSRYKDGDNLYYAGIRVDGHAVIKKKKNGRYHTLAEKPIIEGDYSKDENTNLLPHNEWISLRMETTTEGETVSIKLFIKSGDKAEWTETLSATDSGEEGPPITGTHALGIRTDFMDVEFDNFRAERI